jgi:hypothetical protein
MATASNRLDEDEEFLRQFVFPEEERRLLTSAPWGGNGKITPPCGTPRLRVVIPVVEVHYGHAARPCRCVATHPVSDISPAG